MTSLSFLYMNSQFHAFFTIKCGSRRAEKSRKVLMMMMMKAAETGLGRTRSKAGHGQGRSRAEQSKAEQGRKRAGARKELRRS